MAESEKKPKTITHADGTPATVHVAKEVGNPMPYRIGAIIAWVFAIACEVFAILFVANKIPLTKGNPLVVCIIFLVADLALVIVGSLCMPGSSPYSAIRSSNASPVSSFA